MSVELAALKRRRAVVHGQLWAIDQRITLLELQTRNQMSTATKAPIGKNLHRLGEQYAYAPIPINNQVGLTGEALLEQIKRMGWKVVRAEKATDPARSDRARKVPQPVRG